MKRSNKSPLWRLPADREVAEELEFHLEMRIREYVEEGLDEAEARKKALARFGDPQRHAVECQRLAQGRNRRWQLAQSLEELAQDLRFALRQLRRRPVYALTLIGMLAVGLGATTAVAGLVVDALWQPPPYAEPERLVTVWEAQTSRGNPKNLVSPANFMAFRERLSALESMAAFINVTTNLGGRPRLEATDDQEPGIAPAKEPETPVSLTEIPPQRVKARWTTEGYFDILGRDPYLGRLFEAEDAVDGAPAVAILSHGLWRQRFGGRFDVVGESVVIDGKPREIVGVLPPGVDLSMGAAFSPYGDAADLYMPIPIFEGWREPRGRWMMIVGRLRPDTGLVAAQSQASAVMAEQKEAHPDFNDGWSVSLVPLADHLREPMRTPLLALFGAIGLVLAIVCINASNLLVGRTFGRLRELGVRSALGAGSLRITRQLLVEGALVAVTAGFLGWLVSKALYALGRSQLPAELVPAATNLAGFGRLWPIALGLSLGCVLLLGLLPALPIARRLGQLGHARDFGESVGTRRLRAGLVFGQMVFALILLTGAGLMLRTVLGLLDVDPGFERDRAVSFAVSADRGMEEAALFAFYDELLERLRALPGVETVGAVTHLPMASAGAATSFHATDRAEPEPSQKPVADIRVVEGDYFAAMGIELLDGRTFDGRDREGVEEGAVVVSRAVAERLWPGESALGKGLHIYWGDQGHRQIVGVVEDVHHADLGSDPRDAIYFPLRQERESTLSLVLRLDDRGETGSGLRTLAPSIREIVHELDADLPVYDLRAIGTIVDDSLSNEQFLARVLSLFAVLALILAAVGIYGITALRVRESRREIGVRLALGAAPRQVVGQLLGRTARLAGAAVVVGLGAAFLLGRALESLLFGVQVLDPPTLGFGAFLLALVALGAALVPASGAARLDPSHTLREE